MIPIHYSNQHTWICLHAGSSTELLDITARNVNLFNKESFAITLYRRLYSSQNVSSIHSGGCRRIEMVSTETPFERVRAPN